MKLGFLDFLYSSLAGSLDFQMIDLRIFNRNSTIDGILFRSPFPN